MPVSKEAVPKLSQNPQKNLQNLKNIAFIEFLEFFWTKYILFYFIKIDPILLKISGKMQK